jgi:hypothetical protein
MKNKEYKNNDNNPRGPSVIVKNRRENVTFPQTSRGRLV